MTDSQDGITRLLQCTYEAYRRGGYMALFGSDYISYIQSVSCQEFVNYYLNRGRYRSPLQVAFASSNPRSDEIVLWLLEFSGVVTDKRLFLVKGNQHAHPPISLHDVESYALRGVTKLYVDLQLHDGSNIKCDVDSGPVSKLYMQAVNAARDPAVRDGLTVALPTRRTNQGLTGITLRTETGKRIKARFPKCIVPDNHRWPVRIRKLRQSGQKQG